MRVGDPPVGGRYSLVESFGADERFAGGKVQTWRAQDSLLERAVVLRVITPGGNSAKLFLDRAHEMSLIAHPGLGMVYEAADHGDYAIVVCEWIDGASLAATLEAHGPLTPNQARETLGQVAEAITVAHHAGLPIGGITSERVVVRDNGSVAVTGAPALFADERGDIQQLGTLLYAALTGKEPAPDDPDLAKKLHRGVPRDLAVLCQRALDRDPAKQLGSAAAFAAVLRPRNKPPSATPGTAGRATGRLGGLDGDTTVREHDTSPTRLPRKRKAAGPVTTTDRIPVASNAQGASAALAKTVSTAAPAVPNSSRGGPTAGAPPRKRSPATPPASATQQIPTAGSTPARSSGPDGSPAAPAAALGRTTNASTDHAQPTSATTRTVPVEPPTRRIATSQPSAGSAGPGTPTPTTRRPPPTQAIPTRPREADHSASTVWDVPSAATGAPTQAPPSAANAMVSPEVVREARDALDGRDGRDASVEQAAFDSPGDSAIDTAEDYDPWLDDTGAWGTVDDSDDPEDVSYEGSQTRRKILLYAVPIAALILVVLMAVFVGRQLNAVVNDGPAVIPSSESTGADAATTEGALPSEGTATADPATAVALPMVGAAVFDPFGDGQPEHADDVPLSYDGDPASAWQTFTYQNSAEFGNLKPGVGIIFDLGEEHSVASVELATNLPGSAIEIRAGAAPDAPLDSYQVIGTMDPFTETGTVALEEPVRARFVIVWFVRLVDADGGFQGALAECRILGT